MGPDRAASTPTEPLTRRALREAEAAAQSRGGSGSRAGHPRGRDASHLSRWLPRTALLGALTAITIVLPLTGNVSAGDTAFVARAEAADAGLPGTVVALTVVQVETAPPPAVAATAATSTRGAAAASRSEARDPLPGCDSSIEAPGANGQLERGDLCTLWDGSFQLRGDAASALAELNLAYRARFGDNVCVISAYRTLAQQRTLKATKGGLAATPGRSNHGWGLAVDLCAPETTGASWTWIRANGPIFGWENPDWALSGGSGPHEPWHWEYTRGVEADGEFYTS